MGSLKAFQPAKRLAKKAHRGFRGYPVATVAFYGPDDRRASKVAVGIVLREEEEVAELLRRLGELGGTFEIGAVLWLLYGRPRTGAGRPRTGTCATTPRSAGRSSSSSAGST